MSKIKVNRITNKNGEEGPIIAGITTVNSTGAMRIPSGNTGMRVEYSSVKENQIVKDGLILHIDLANPDCYNYDRGDNKIHDLSGAGVYDVGTMSGDCIYTSDGGGCLHFGGSGVRGVVDFGSLDMNGPFVLRQDSNQAISVCSWVNVDMSNSANVVVGNWYNTSVPGWFVSVNENNNTGNRPMPAALVSDGADGSGAWARPGWNGTNIPAYDPRSLNYWNTVKSVNSGIGNTTVAVGRDIFTNVGQTLVRWRGTRNTAADGWGTRTWINGLKNGMATPVFENSGYGYQSEIAGPWGHENRSLTMGADNNSSGSWMKGKIAVMMIYNRELTHAEMQQNFNAQSYRFGR